MLGKILRIITEAMRKFFFESKNTDSWAKKQISEMARLGGKLVL